MGAETTATALVQARTTKQGLPAFPGEAPTSLDEAYAVQDHAIEHWPHSIVGWKVGYIAPAKQTPGGDTRLVGPIWDHQLVRDEDGPEMSIFSDGFAAVEAELVLELGADQPERDAPWTPEDTQSIPARLFGGIEIASSPIPSINDLGPTVVTADFGNNNGLIVGPEITDWADLDLDATPVSTTIDGTEVGTGTPANLPGGIADSFAQALTIMARRGRPLKAGDLVATGALTGIHDVVPGQRVVVSFGDLPVVRCSVVAPG